MNIYDLSNLNKNVYYGIFEGSKHDSEIRVTKTKVADSINVKFVRLSRKADPLLEEVKK
jgi:hypothetical protein